MTINIYFVAGNEPDESTDPDPDSDDPDPNGLHLCNNGGWYAVTVFADTLDPDTEPNTIILGDRGWCDDLPALKEELSRVAPKAGEPAREIIEKIVHLIDIYGKNSIGIMITS